MSKYQLRVQPSTKPIRIRNKTGAEIDAKIKAKRNQQLDEAIAYCKENDCSVHTALQTKLFPHVKRMSLHRRLTGEVRHGRECDYCRILMVSEEQCLVKYIKNSNRSYQPLNRADIGAIIVNILLARRANNKRLGHRNCTRLNENAKRVVERQKLGRRFWTRFNAAHGDLSIKRRGNISVNRALNCTRAMAEQHIDELAEELQAAGIMKGASKTKSGVWTGGNPVIPIQKDLILTPY